MVDRGVFQAKIRNGATGMQNCSVVASTESLTNGRETGRRQFLGKPHGDLAGTSHDTRPFLRVHVGNLDLVVFGHGLLDRLEGNLPVMSTK